MSKSEILKDRLVSIRDQLKFLGIESNFDADNNRFTLSLKNSNISQYGIMLVIERTRDIHYMDTFSGRVLVDIRMHPYADDSVDVTIVTIEPRCDYYLGFIENMVILIYNTSEVDINDYYKSVKNSNMNDTSTEGVPSHWQGGIPAHLERNNFLYHDKICEFDHVKTTFVCPSCWGRVSFNVKSETTFSITSDIDNFDIERSRTTFSPVCLNCNQSMFECDEDFVDRIIKLNLLDIVTEYCCSGHKEVIDRISTNGDNTERKEINDYSYPYIMINLAETKPEVISIILSKAQKNSNLRVEFMNEDPFIRIAPVLPEYIIVNGTMPYEEDQKNMKDILFKFVDSIIRRFDKENKND